MKIVAKILDALGISQRSLASFVDAHHSHLSRYEAATRSLPVPAMLQLALMQQQLLTLTAPPQAMPSTTDIATMQQQAAWCVAQCHPLKKQLLVVETHYRQAATMLQFLEAYTIANPVLSEKKQRWIDEQRYQATKKLEQNGWLCQQQLRHKIDLLQYEAGLLAP